MSLREYKVMASSMTATYTAGRWCAESPQQACEMARRDYQNSRLGMALKDAGGFRFYVVDKFPHEREEQS